MGASNGEKGAINWQSLTYEWRLNGSFDLTLSVLFGIRSTGVKFYAIGPIMLTTGALINSMVI